MVPRISAARVLLLLTEASVRRISSRSPSSSVVPSGSTTTFARSGGVVPSGDSGRHSGVTSPSSHDTTARSITLRSSRTLPGQEWSESSLSAAASTLRTSRPYFSLNSAMNASARSAMSSGRRRSGGSGIVSTLTR